MFLFVHIIVHIIVHVAVDEERVYAKYSKSCLSTLTSESARVTTLNRWQRTKSLDILNKFGTVLGNAFGIDVINVPLGKIPQNGNQITIGNRRLVGSAQKLAAIGFEFGFQIFEKAGQLLFNPCLAHLFYQFLAIVRLGKAFGMTVGLRSHTDVQVG